MAQSSICKIFSTTFLLVLMFTMSHAADITKADVGHNGNIVKVKPTHVSVAKKGHGIADVHLDGIEVGKDGSIANVEKNDIRVGKPGDGIVDLGKFKPHALRGPRQ
ncbi:hypothetical protein MKW98_022531 [Papaver atlanticum]|uniref:Uncharacterized protein n=1 Tax=Papaver atlanticum TaxID=357466 RepID=A0AAD4T1M0_9MAGN|nr:hypothetical protein MKW98_022531 [Papaver atlanticum]